MDKKLRNIIIYITVAVMVVLGVAFLMTKNSSESYSTSQLVNLFKEDKVQSYTVNYGTGAIEITLKEGVKLKPAKDIATADSIVQNTTDDNITATDPDGKNAKSSAKNVVVRGTLADIERFIDDISVYTASADEAVSYDYIKGSDNTLLYEFLPILVTGILFVVVWIFIMKKMGGGLGGKEMNFGKAKIKNTNDEKRKTTFEDVAGADEEKEELEEIVEFLKAPDKYNKLGARIPKGVLLVGPPGTGKTLLARAVAGEAGVPFFSISGSDFVEMFVGVGASRVRDLFEQAKKNSPCIIFIDEIDAVGRQRGAGLGGGHDEREQTLNQLLVEMDGFGANEGVILIAATNRPDVLDPALMRPGRFDRQVIVSYPDINGREAILKVHARKKPLAPDVKLKTIAKTTAGFTGADLENLLNEAAIEAARKGRGFILQSDIKGAFIKVGIGAEKKSKVISEKEKKITAYHESGHAILFHVLPDMDPVYTISIIPTGMGAAGYTMPLPDNDEMFNTKGKMLQDIMTLLGGRIAEEIIFGDITTGASNDIKRATATARSMVMKYGMSDKLGLICYGDDDDEVFIGRDLAHTRSYSEDVAKAIDEEIHRIISECHEQAKAIILEHEDVLHSCAKLLLEKEKVHRDEFEALFTTENPKTENSDI